MPDWLEKAAAKFNVNVWRMSYISQETNRDPNKQKIDYQKLVSELSKEKAQLKTRVVELELVVENLSSELQKLNDEFDALLGIN